MTEPMAAPVAEPMAEVDYCGRIRDVLRATVDARLDGLLVTPGPDLRYLTGYQPVGSDRLTMLVLAPDQDPTMVVPRPERGDVERSGAPLVLADWADGENPYQSVAGLLRPEGNYGITDSAWAAHLLGLQGVRAGCRFTALGRVLPMLRRPAG